MLNCNQFSMWRKNTDEKEKERREKAIKFGRELRLTRQGPKRTSRIEATRPWYQLEKENDCFRCARAGRVNVDFEATPPRIFAVSTRVVASSNVLIPRYPFTLNRPLLVINNFCAQECDRKLNYDLLISTASITNVSTLPLSRRALSILLFSEKHPHGPTTDSNKTCGRHLETNFPFLDIPR